MHKIPGMAVLLVGRSGVGKTALVKTVLARGGGRYTHSMSATTRLPRDDDMPGNHRHMSRKQFEAMAERGGRSSTTSSAATSTVRYATRSSAPCGKVSSRWRSRRRSSCR